MQVMQDSQEVSKHHENALQSVEMLRAVIGGETYEAVAMRFGVSRTAVERRIKSVAVQLTQVVGVDGLKEESERRGPGSGGQRNRCRLLSKHKFGEFSPTFSRNISYFDSCRSY